LTDRTKSIWEATYQSGSTKLEELVADGVNADAGSPEVVNKSANEAELSPFKAQFDESCLNFIVS